MREEIARGFTLLAFGDQSSATVAFERSAQKYGVPLTILRDTFRNGRTRYETPLVLVRPDQFVAWTGDRAPDDPDAVIAKVAGHGAPA